MIFQVSYDYKTEQFTSQNFPNETQLGWIAQDVQLVVPELVTQGKDGFLYVSYSHGVPLIGQAVAELSEKVDEHFQIMSECSTRVEMMRLHEELAEKNNQIVNLQADLKYVLQKIAHMELLITGRNV